MIVVTNVIAVSGRSPFNQAGTLWALGRDGTLIGIGTGLGQANVYTNLSNVLAVAAGYSQHLAIVGDSFPQPIEPMQNAGFSQGRFIISQPTTLGRSYRLEYKGTFTGDWQMFPPSPGDGNAQSLADPNPSPAQRFYRIHVSQ